MLLTSRNQGESGRLGGISIALLLLVITVLQITQSCNEVDTYEPPRLLNEHITTEDQLSQQF